MILDNLINLQLDGNSRKFVYRDSNNIQWMCKFDKLRGNQRMHDSISEHIACKVLNKLGYKAQVTKLDEIYGEICVLCRLDSYIEQLKHVKSYMTQDRLEYNIDILLNYSHQKPNIDLVSFKKDLINRLPMDYILMNVDLHPGNIGFVRKENVLYSSYIYDMGGALLSKYALNEKEYLRQVSKIKETIRFGNKNINIHEFVAKYNLKKLVIEKYVLFMLKKKELLIELKEESPEIYHNFIDNSFNVVINRFMNIINNER